MNATLPSLIPFGLPQFDLPSFDLPSFDLPSFDLAARTWGLLAQSEGDGALRALQLDLPQSGVGWAAYAAVAVAVLAYAGFLYVLDTRTLAPIWRVWLLLLRLGVFAGIAVIALNPQERTQRKSFQPSRVVIAVDTSLSMGQPETQPAGGTVVAPDGTAAGGTGDASRTRAEAVADLLAKSPLLEELSRQHEVSVFKFDSTLHPQLHQRRAQNDPTARRPGMPGPEETKSDGESKSGADEKAGADGKTGTQPAPGAETPVDWKDLLQPAGHESRYGDALRDLIGQSAGPTLSGVVVIGDGQSNAGIDPQTAHDLARAGRVRLVTAGIGSTERQANLRLVDIQAPGDVHVGDPYELTAFVQSQGLAGRTAEVELLMKVADDPNGEVSPVETRTVPLVDDGVPQEVRFERTPTVVGAVQYIVRVKPTVRTVESHQDDNQGDHVVRVVDRKLRVLLVAGGPMREYHFLRNMLFRHKAVKLDVLLQTVDAKIAGKVSQESDKLLTEFPETEADLFEYDVIVAFDPKWSALSPTSVELLSRWVFEHGGGLMLVAGDVHTRELAAGADDLAPIRELYPVVLSPLALDLGAGSSAEIPYPPAFTDDGTNAGFLQLADDPARSADEWQRFSGTFRCYPTQGVKSGATVYARFPKLDVEQGVPVLLAGQFYGSGRTMYLGSPEMWRLRSLDEQYHDRFWTKLIREIGQGRLKSGGSRAILMPEKQVYYLGQTVRLRARILDQQYKPLDADAVTVEVYDARGKALVPAPRLLRDKNRPGEFSGDFRASVRGKYDIELKAPDSGNVQRETIQVRLPNLEAEHPEQNARLLTELARDTGGRYLRLEELAAELPKLLPVVSKEILVDERLRTLWDRDWVLYLIVGLLSVEWLTRKLLKLA